MGRITLELLRKRSEHNENCVATLEEIALHQQNIERIELLGHYCRHLKILYLQNNLIGKIQNLHRLRELEYLNLAINNVTRIQNLQKCESLKKLDLTVNFIDKSAILSVPSLAANYQLKELYLVGNPCTEWHGYRQYVIAKLPLLQKLDGSDIKRSERILALQELPVLEDKLKLELIDEGIDPEFAAHVEDDSLLDENGEIPETGYVDESGEMRRPWCPSTRLLEHRESEELERVREEKLKKSHEDMFGEKPKPKGRLQDFPTLEAGAAVKQKNEGKWNFTLDESEDRKAVVLDVAISKNMDTSLIQADVQPTFVRLLIKGRLLQLKLPTQVKPDTSSAQRSTTTGHLVLKMPKENPRATAINIPYVRSAQGKEIIASRSTNDHDGRVEIRPTAKSASKAQDVNFRCITRGRQEDNDLIKAIQKAKVEVAPEDDEYIPPL